MENSKIISYLKNKYGKINRLPQVVTMYKTDPEKGWLILSINWKKEMLERFSNDITNLSDTQKETILTTAMSKGL